ncbi:MAG TPA: hypothetical protein VHJ83_01640, partial [Micromonosporaceae bacterium]|nr:hypothetical protein [Micromonosporaceae bacterium]
LLRRAFLLGFLGFTVVTFFVSCLGLVLTVADSASSDGLGSGGAIVGLGAWALAMPLGIAGFLAAFLFSLLTRHPELVSEWHLVLDGQAGLAESAYAALFENLIHRRRAPVSGKVHRIRNRHASNQESWHLVIADGQWGMYISAFGYGGDLYLGWQLWRHQRAMGLVLEYFKAQFKPPYQDIAASLEADRVRAMRDAVHNAFRAAIEDIAAGHQRRFAQVYGQEVQVEDPDAPAMIASAAQAHQYQQPPFSTGQMPTVTQPAGAPGPAQPPTWSPPKQSTPPHPVSGPPADAPTSETQGPGPGGTPAG